MNASSPVLLLTINLVTDPIVLFHLIRNYWAVRFLTISGLSHAAAWPAWPTVKKISERCAEALNPFNGKIQ
jgi:hypothetical protein